MGNKPSTTLEESSTVKEKHVDFEQQESLLNLVEEEEAIVELEEEEEAFEPIIIGRKEATTDHLNNSNISFSDLSTSLNHPHHQHQQYSPSIVGMNPNSSHRLFSEQSQTSNQSQDYGDEILAASMLYQFASADHQPINIEEEVEVGKNMTNILDFEEGERTAIKINQEELTKLTKDRSTTIEETWINNVVNLSNPEVDQQVKLSEVYMKRIASHVINCVDVQTQKLASAGITKTIYDKFVKKSVESFKKRVNNISDQKVTIYLFGPTGYGKTSLISAFLQEKIVTSSRTVFDTTNITVYGNKLLKIVDIIGFGDDQEMNAKKELQNHLKEDPCDIVLLLLNPMAFRQNETVLKAIFKQLEWFKKEAGSNISILPVMSKIDEIIEDANFPQNITDLSEILAKVKSKIEISDKLYAELKKVLEVDDSSTSKQQFIDSISLIYTKQFESSPTNCNTSTNCNTFSYYNNNKQYFRYTIGMDDLKNTIDKFIVANGKLIKRFKETKIDFFRRSLAAQIIVIFSAINSALGAIPIADIPLTTTFTSLMIDLLSLFSTNPNKTSKSYRNANIISMTTTTVVRSLLFAGAFIVDIAGSIAIIPTFGLSIATFGGTMVGCSLIAASITSIIGYKAFKYFIGPPYSGEIRQSIKIQEIAKLYKDIIKLNDEFFIITDYYACKLLFISDSESSYLQLDTRKGDPWGVTIIDDTLFVCQSKSISTFNVSELMNNFNNLRTTLPNTLIKSSINFGISEHDARVLTTMSHFGKHLHICTNDSCFYLVNINDISDYKEIKLVNPTLGIETINNNTIVLQDRIFKQITYDDNLPSLTSHQNLVKNLNNFTKFTVDEFGYVIFLNESNQLIVINECLQFTQVIKLPSFTPTCIRHCNGTILVCGFADSGEPFIKIIE